MIVLFKNVRFAFRLFRHAVVAFALLAAAYNGVPHAVAGTYEPFNQTAFSEKVAKGSPVIIHTHEDWCVTCVMQERALKDLLQQPEYLGITIYQVNMSQDRDAALSFGLSQRSTLVAFRNGTETGRLFAETRERKVRELLNTIMW